MRRSKRIFILTTFIALIITLAFAGNGFGQPPPPPPPQVGHGASGNVPGSGGAPIGEGIWILISLAFSYSVYYYMHKKENQQNGQIPEGLLPDTSARIPDREKANISTAKRNFGVKNRVSARRYFQNSQKMLPLIRRIYFSTPSPLKK